MSFLDESGPGSSARHFRLPVSEMADHAPQQSRLRLALGRRLHSVLPLLFSSYMLIYIFALYIYVPSLYSTAASHDATKPALSTRDCVTCSTNSDRSNCCQSEPAKKEPIGIIVGVMFGLGVPILAVSFWIYWCRRHRPGA